MSTGSNSSSFTSTLSSFEADPSRQRLPLTARHYQQLLVGDTQLIDEVFAREFRLSDLVWAPNGNTVLHVAASAGQESLLSSILSHERELLYCPNSEGDLPIHVAVRTGQFRVVKALVDLSAGNHDHMLRWGNNESNTALHIALENHQEDIATWLFQKCPATFYFLNAPLICPLYLAIKAEFWDLVKEMLQHRFVAGSDQVERTLTTPRAKSVVHALIAAKKKEFIEMINDKYPNLLHTLDEHETTRPFSYAAYIGFLEGVKIFFDKLPHEAFQHNEDDSFPIHNACSGGYVEVVQEFLKQCPHAKWLLNAKRQNILHVAACHGKVKVVEYLLKHCQIDRLINMKDRDGNTPLHLAAKGKHAKVVYALTWDPRVKLTIQNGEGLMAIELAEECVDVPSLEERLTWLALVYANAPPSPGNSNDHDQKKAPNMYYKDRLNTLLTVSILVATVTFAAGFTVPGGYNSDNNQSTKPQHQNDDQGMAILARKHAFQVFVLSDTVALCASIFAAVTLIWAHLDDPGLCLRSLHFALPSIALALAMMSVAFVAGLYVVLHDLCGWLALIVLFMGCCFLPVVLTFFVPLFFPRSSCKSSKFLRYVFCVTFNCMLMACDDLKGNQKNPKKVAYVL